MKKYLAFLLAVLMVLAACSKVPEEPKKPENSSEPEIEQTEKPVTTSPVDIEYLRENFPKIDGSTSLIPLEAGIRSAIFGKTMEEATADVAHTGTWSSYYDLVRGRNDMIFSCPLSEEQWEQAKEQGVTLETVPVAYEGFVFVVNAKNPVDELSQEQLRKIYSGEITNWKEVGGNDAEIIAYQRNNDSGSQNYMIEFMGEVPLMDAPLEGRPSSMVGLMDAVAYNDNAENAIGYSVYAYAADMYGGGNDIKFIKVDGADVDKNSMSKGEYPLMGYNYAVFNANEPEDSPVRKLVEWMVSDEGQLAVAKAGYVTLRDIGFSYEEKYIEIYSGTGTGKTSSGKIPSYQYTMGEGTDEFIPLEIKAHPDGTETYYLEALADKTLEAEVNGFILESIKICSEKLPQMREDIEKFNNSNGASAYIKADKDAYYEYERYEAYAKGQPASVYVSAKNGYLSVAVTMEYDYIDNTMSESIPMNYYTETAVWDMEYKKRLSAEELFFEGTDIGKVLNEYMHLAVHQPASEFGDYYPQKADFVGMPKEGWKITADRIWFDFDNPYFKGGAVLKTDILLDDYMVTSVLNGMEEYFTELEPVKFFRDGTRNVKYQKISEEIGENTWKYGYAVLRDEYKNAEKINRTIENYYKKYYSYEAVSEELSKDGEPYYSYWDFTDAKILGNKYFIVMAHPQVKYISETLREVYSKTPTMIFDMETGKQIKFTDMLTKAGKKRAKAEGFDKFDIVESFRLDGKNIKVNFVRRDPYDIITFVLNEEDIKW
ncbi:MAG: substrate-binding domain-containing protein [Oscillospiraceae bacterium]|nr:substrate-binding domain-containing protein [Oscillospiraceae bacterium]